MQILPPHSAASLLSHRGILPLKGAFKNRVGWGGLSQTSHVDITVPGYHTKVRQVKMDILSITQTSCSKPQHSAHLLLNNHFSPPTQGYSPPMQDTSPPLQGTHHPTQGKCSPTQTGCQPFPTALPHRTPALPHWAPALPYRAPALQPCASDLSPKQQSPILCAFQLGTSVHLHPWQKLSIHK